MFTLTDLTLVNFRNHGKLALKFKPGVTGIVGANGAGKSSIVEAIQFALVGTLFAGTKHEAIKLGEDSGYVVLGFSVDGKKGTITRHLDISKAVLVYNKEEPLVKAGEVKELWDKLLQISREIVERVIIAQQGKIPMLFSGDSTVREKIFQKIFMVPETDKLRKIVFDNYIKQCPPVIPIEDVDQLVLNKVQLEKEIAMLEYKIKKLTVLPEEELDERKRRLAYLSKCIDDSVKIEQINQALQDICNEEYEIDNEIQRYTDLLNTINIEDYEKQYETMLQQKSMYDRKLRIDEQFNQLRFPFDAEQFLLLETEATILEQETHQLSNDLMEIKINLSNTKRQLEHFSDLHGQQDCPTCGQSLQSIQQILLEFETSKINFEQDLKKTQAKHISASTKLNKVHEDMESYKKIALAKERLEESKKLFKDITYDPEDLAFFKEVIDQYKQYESEMNDLFGKRTKIRSRSMVVKMQLDSLSRYDKKGDILAEREEILASITLNTENQRSRQTQEVSLRVKQFELNTFSGRIKTNQENREKNTKRNKYLEVLNQVYDVYHSSNFPRKLILDYADVVTEFLQDNLNNFNIPYRAEVADNFKINMIDEDGRLLPRVSGGQEIQVGICLHLALHDLFSQSFPLMILDEGTTHLDEKNRKAYFDIVKMLKTKDSLKQIIIIDHDPQLSEVVDHVIELGNAE